ncbi:hypothetical protein F4810DRAFT_197018 [Camillea tinctor]|nr:hypothetical protein F4810DRAFT_197018 [Camillea tinctor]
MIVSTFSLEHVDPSQSMHDDVMHPSLLFTLDFFSFFFFFRTFFFLSFYYCRLLSPPFQDNYRARALQKRILGPGVLVRIKRAFIGFFFFQFQDIFYVMVRFSVAIVHGIDKEKYFFYSFITLRWPN